MQPTYEEVLKRLISSSVVIGNLPEASGYNGSVRQIDDDEAETIEKDMDNAVVMLTELKQQNAELLADALRWRHFADNPQTALCLGTELNPNDTSINWLEESNKLADIAIAKATS